MGFLSVSCLLIKVPLVFHRIILPSEVPITISVGLSLAILMMAEFPRLVSLIFTFTLIPLLFFSFNLPD